MSTYVRLFLSTVVRPRIIPFEFSKSPIYSGQSVQVTCLLSEGDSPLEIFWKHQGTKGIVVNKMGRQGSSLLIDDVDLEHRGNYTCYAKNMVGIVSHTAVLEVQGKFLILPQPNRLYKTKKCMTRCIRIFWISYTYLLVHLIAFLSPFYSSGFLCRAFHRRS